MELWLKAGYVSLLFWEEGGRERKVYKYIYMYIHIHIYIHRARERASERERERDPRGAEERVCRVATPQSFRRTEAAPAPLEEGLNTGEFL